MDLMKPYREAWYEDYTEMYYAENNKEADELEIYLNREQYIRYLERVSHDFTFKKTYDGVLQGAGQDNKFRGALDNAL